MKKSCLVLAALWGGMMFLQAQNSLPEATAFRVKECSKN